MHCANTLAAAALAAAALTPPTHAAGDAAWPDGLRVDDKGTLHFPGGAIEMKVWQAGWTGAVRQSPGTRTDAPNGAARVEGTCALGPVAGRYAAEFRPSDGGALAAHWEYGMDAPIETATSCAAATVRHAEVKGVFIDGDYRALPLGDGIEYTFSPKSLAIVLEGGRTLEIGGVEAVHYIDYRRLGNDTSSFRLLMRRRAGVVLTNSLDAVLRLGAVPQTPCAALPGSAEGRALSDLGPAPPPGGRVASGGVSFLVGRGVAEIPPDGVEISVPPGTLGMSLLHTLGAETAEDGEAVGRVEFVMDDGSVRAAEVRAGEDIGPSRGLRDMANARPALKEWMVDRFDGLYASHFPTTERIAAVRLRSLRPDWLVAAATFTEAPVWFRPFDTGPVVIAEGPDWRRLDFTGRTEPGSALDFSGFAGPPDVPAGIEGPVETTPDGHFRLAGSGRPIRFLGANVIGAPLVADAAEAAEMAARMRRCGYNAVRFHHFEREIVAPDAASSLDIDPERLDRFLGVWDECVRAGLYVSYDLYASREPHPGEIEGVAGRKGRPAYKASLAVSRPHTENFKEWCRRFLNIVNPRTGLRIADDPAVMGVNIINEDDIGLLWHSAREAWLAAWSEHRRAHPGLAPEAELSNPDFKRFLYGRQSAFHREMADFLKNEIGLKAPLTGMNMTARLDLAFVGESFDWVDKHCYWAHPNKLDPAQDGLVPNAYAQTGSPIESLGSPAPREIAIARLVGKPMGCTEWNYCYPNRFRHEGTPIFAACAAFQDWDALFRFMWTCGPWSLNRPFHAVPFEEAADPVMQLSDRIAAALFLRGDLAPGERGYVFAADGPNPPAGLEAVARIAVGNAASSRDEQSKTASPPLAPADSDALRALQSRRYAATPDGQIDIDGAAHTLRIVTPRSEVLSLGRGALVGDLLAVEDARGFQTLAAISLDGRPLADSRRIVLIHLPDVQNSGVAFSDGLYTVQTAWGELPLLAHRSACTAALRLPEGFRVTALSADGRVLGPVAGERREGHLRFAVDPAAFDGCALAYELARQP